MQRRALLAPGVVTGEFETVLGSGRVRCELCPRLCTMHEGQRSFCFVREVRGGHVVLSAYGRSSGFCVDPVEKKPLNHFYPGTAVLSFGTAGCNLGCRFCQNHDMSKAREVEKLARDASPDDIAQAALDAGCGAVAFTYNDPVIFHEYASDTAQACRERGIKSIAVTAGYLTARARPAFFRHMDAANVDLKAFTEQFYDEVCFAELAPVLETLHYVKHETDVWLEVTTLLIPGKNDGEDEVARLCDWMARELGPDVPLHFSAFHPDFKMLDLERTPAATLTRAREQARAAGLRYVYTGNVHDPEGGSTRCHGCGGMLIERDWYELGAYNVRGGACAGCGTPVAGHFADAPGDWGRRRRVLEVGRAVARELASR